LLEAVDEKERKQYAKDNEPVKVHQNYVDKKIAESEITTENVSQIKATDKEKVAKLEALEKVLEKAEEKGVLTEEHKKLKAAIAAHKATFTPSEEKGPKKEEKPSTPKEKEEGDKGKDKSKEKGKDEKGKEKAPETP